MRYQVIANGKVVANFSATVKNPDRLQEAMEWAEQNSSWFSVVVEKSKPVRVVAVISNHVWIRKP